MAVNHLPGRKGPTLLPISSHQHPIPCPLIYNQVLIDLGPDKSPGGLHTSVERSKAQEEVSCMKSEQQWQAEKLCTVGYL